MIHEIAHGSTASFLGDQTAKEQGRLTLNPLKHIDLFGSIILPLFLLAITFGRGPIFGWAKPVPINPFNLRDQNWGLVKVSLAGPSTNFLIALIFGLAIRFLDLAPVVLTFFSIITVYNFAWGIFNLIPFPPLDGSHILLKLIPEKFLALKAFLRQYGFFMLLFFIFLGLNWLFRAAIILYSFVSGQPLNI